MKNNKSEPILVMDYRQYRRVRRLVHECCNYIDGNCIALDDGEECVCVQSISYSLLCRWFRAAVLPQDKELETALFHRLNAKKCAVIITTNLKLSELKNPPDLAHARIYDRILERCAPILFSGKKMPVLPDRQQKTL